MFLVRHKKRDVVGRGRDRLQEMRQESDPRHEAFMYRMVSCCKGLCRRREIRPAYEGHKKAGGINKRPLLERGLDKLI